METSGEHLLDIISDIVDFAKIEADKLEIVREPFSFRDVLNQIKERYNLRASEKGLFFKITVSDTVPELVTGDRKRIQQIISNISDNAVKFTNRGGVYVDCSYEFKFIKIIIKDTGIGISKAKQNLIFEPFIQADGSSTREFGGTGLGLAISLKIAILMGGNIKLESSEGEGSSFTVIIPLPSSTQKTPIKSDISHDKNKTELISEAVTTPNYETKKGDNILEILVAEDNPVNQKVIKAYFKKMKRDCDLAENGRIAVDMMYKKHYDILILDMQMPIMGGIEVLELIKKDSKFKKPHIIAVTADAMKGDAEKYIEAGCSDYLPKPVDYQILNQKITAIADQLGKL